VKWHETPETPEITGGWKRLKFSKRLNFQVAWYYLDSRRAIF
jgi:hypothetical protein